VVLLGGCSPQPVQSVQVKELACSGSSWDGAALPSYPRGKPEVKILQITIPPKATLPLHHHPVINAGVLLRGELTVTTETGKTLEMKAGNSLIEVVGTRHYGRNDGSVPAEIIVFYAGVQGTPVTVK
jgi:quercetin dioxygenase-like cupin family protein